MAELLTASRGTQLFGATFTTDEVLSEIDLRGKRILVTGVSAGLGVETARSLPRTGRALWAQCATWTKPNARPQRCERMPRRTAAASS